MRNLTPYDEDSLEFFREVFASKRNSNKDPNYRERVQNILPILIEKFEDYDDNFNSNLLIDLVNHGFEENDKTDLIKLYSYRSKLMQNLKILLTTNDVGRILNTCQNCCISEVNSFDHFVSKGEFPEFSVHPKNLFPSCTVCNSYKGEIWRADRAIQYLNLYLDDLPDEQYLFVNIEIIGGVVTSEFYLDNPNGVDHLLFGRIQSHYDELHLCDRYQQNSHEIITTLENTIREYRNTLPLEDCIDLAVGVSRRNMDSFGHNYWKSILEITLLENDQFIQFLSE